MSEYPSSPAPASAQTNTLAMASLITSIAAWVIGGLGSCGTLFLFPPLAICTGIVFVGGSIAAAVTGHMGRNQIRASGGAQTGDGLALTGLVLGWGGVGTTVLLLCLGVLGMFGLILMGPSIGNVFSNILENLLTATPAP